MFTNHVGAVNDVAKRLLIEQLLGLNLTVRCFPMLNDYEDAIEEEHFRGAYVADYRRVSLGIGEDEGRILSDVNYPGDDISEAVAGAQALFFDPTNGLLPSIPPDLPFLYVGNDDLRQAYEFLLEERSRIVVIFINRYKGTNLSKSLRKGGRIVRDNFENFDCHFFRLGPAGFLVISKKNFTEGVVAAMTNCLALQNLEDHEEADVYVRKLT